jgi:hypothetical protein
VGWRLEMMLRTLQQVPWCDERLFETTRLSFGGGTMLEENDMHTLKSLSFSAYAGTISITKASSDEASPLSRIRLDTAARIS